MNITIPITIATTIMIEAFQTLARASRRQTHPCSLTHQCFRRVRAFGVQSVIEGKQGSDQAGNRQRESGSSHSPGSEHTHATYYTA